jgi:hypothetical protein
MDKPENGRGIEEINISRGRNLVVPTESGIVGRVPGNVRAPPMSSKIVFLGKDNLDKLRGYKAYLDLLPNGEVCLILAGLNLASAKALYDSMEQMKDEEIHGK